MNQRILVTGGSGLLGSYCIRWLQQCGYDAITATFQGDEKNIPVDLRQGVVWMKLSLPDQVGTLDVVQDQDWVIHTAALVSHYAKDRFNLLDVNQTGTRQIVDACVAFGVQHLIYVGSIGALGKEKNGVTLTEKSDWLDNEYATPYGLSKYLGELEAWRGQAEGLNVSVVLPSVILGTGDWNKSSLQLIGQVTGSNPFYPGGQTGYVDVRDVARFMEMLLRQNLTGHRYILSAEDISYQNLYAQISAMAGLGKKHRLAPEWLARLILVMLRSFSRKKMTPEFVKQVYGTFSYNASSSRQVEGFDYRPIRETLEEIVRHFQGKSDKPLIFN